MPTLFERAAEVLTRKMLAAFSEDGVLRVITYTRKSTSHTPRGWIGRGMQFTEVLTGQRVEISEREFFVIAADMEAAGLVEPQKGDRLQVAGESWVWEVLDPSLLAEPESRFSNAERTWYRIHTKLVK